MRNIALRLAFEGTNYHGWQKQLARDTIEGRLEAALEKILGAAPKIMGCSRTDAGVHALDYVCAFFCDSPIPPPKFAAILNGLLPSDIRIFESSEAPIDFNPRFCNGGKIYSYFVRNSRGKSPFLRNYALDFPFELDVCAMNEAARFLVGEHDFSSFMSSGGSQITTVRTIYSCDVNILKTADLVDFFGIIQNDEKILKIEIDANAYLYNMVRIIAGTLLDVGRNKISPRDVSLILAAKNRNLAGFTAPAHGLFLRKVKTAASVSRSEPQFRIN
jgi:tRNA pseudouridine38-40 synthase